VQSCSVIRAEWRVSYLENLSSLTALVSSISQRTNALLGKITLSRILLLLLDSFRFSTLLGLFSRAGLQLVDDDVLSLNVLFERFVFFHGDIKFGLQAVNFFSMLISCSNMVSLGAKDGELVGEVFEHFDHVIKGLRVLGLRLDYDVAYWGHELIVPATYFVVSR
jgi:hypothetical protein